MPLDIIEEVDDLLEIDNMTHTTTVAQNRVTERVSPTHTVSGTAHAIDDFYNSNAYQRFVLEDLQRYVTKKSKKNDTFKKEILLSSIHNRDYVLKSSQDKEECRKYFETAIKSCEFLSQEEILKIYKVFEFSVGYYDEDMIKRDILLRNLLIKVIGIFQQEDNLSSFDNFKTSTNENLIKKTGEMYDACKKYSVTFLPKFLNIIGGYLNKTKNYDRNSKFVRNFRDTENF